MIGTQSYLMVSGNYAWLNALTLVIAFVGLPDAWLSHLWPGTLSAQEFAEAPYWYLVLVLLVGGLVVVLSYWPVRNLTGPGQRMNYSFNRLHLVNTYGAFGSVTRERHEVVLEGTTSEKAFDGAVWQEYEFRAKPGGPWRRPPQFAPYHLRLDWLMWFAALSPRYAEDWLLPLVHRLLQNDPATLRLLRRSPFTQAPPVWRRTRAYGYR